MSQTQSGSEASPQEPDAELLRLYHMIRLQVVLSKDHGDLAGLWWH